jgi:hypothetical protein
MSWMFSEGRPLLATQPTTMLQQVRTPRKKLATAHGNRNLTSSAPSAMIAPAQADEVFGTYRSRWRWVARQGPA